MSRVGGALGPAIEPFLPMIQAVVAQQAFRALSNKFEIKISRLGADAYIMGAVAMVLDEALSDPSWRTSVNSQFRMIDRPHHMIM